MPQQLQADLPSKANYAKIEELQIERVFPKKTIKTLSFIQFLIVGLSAISQLVLMGAVIGYSHWNRGGRNYRFYYDYGVYDSDSPYYLAGIWTGLIFGISGGIGLVTAHAPTNCTYVHFKVLVLILGTF